MLDLDLYVVYGFSNLECSMNKIIIYQSKL